MASSTATWEVSFSGSLSNRIYYFFRKHPDGKIVVSVAEWPGTVVDGKLVAPEEVPCQQRSSVREIREAFPRLSPTR
jgi:hypothetical protein